MPACHNGNFSELFRSSAILVHMATCCHGISTYERDAVRSFIRCLWNGSRSSSCAEHTPTAGELCAGVGD